MSTMSAKTQDLLNMFNMLPESEQDLAFEMVKRIFLAWDSDYTKITPAERARLDQSEKDLRSGNTVDYKDIDWN